MKSKKALLLIDIQNDYFENGRNPLVDSSAAASKATSLIRYFRMNHLPVIHVRHISCKPDATFFLQGTIGAEIYHGLAPMENEPVIIKHFPNSFYRTELHELLQTMEVQELVICGMMTHMCIDATTRAAKDLGYHCIVAHDACATKDMEFNGIKVEASKVQAAFLAALSPYYATIYSTDTLIKQTANGISGCTVVNGW